MTYYCTLKSFPHYGEKGAIIKVENGIMTVALMDCAHGNHLLEITRKDI